MKYSYYVKNKQYKIKSFKGMNKIKVISQNRH